MKKKVISMLLILSMIMTFAIGCTNKDNGEEEVKEETYTPVEVTEVISKDLAKITTMSGKISPNKDVMVMPDMPGKVETVKVKDGDQVNKGDLLFTLDKKDIQKQVDQAKAAYDLAAINYDISQDQAGKTRESYERTKALTETVLNNARINLENTRKLYEAGAVPQTQLEQAEISFEQQETQLQTQLDQAELGASNKVTDLASGQLKQAELAYNQAKDALNNTLVTAPISGIITGNSLEPGIMVSNAQPSMNIVDINKVYVSIEVVEGLVNKLKKGQEVDLTISSISPEPIKAIIDSINPIPDARTQLYLIKIYVENTDNEIKPGMFANVDIPLEIKNDILSVPSEAVILRNEKTLVYIVKDGKAVEKEIEIGLDTGTEVEVVQGLEENDKVIIKGFDYVKNGDEVKVVGGTEE